MSRIRCNVGMVERVVRITVGLAILALGISFQSWWGLVGLLPLLTAVVGWCPLSALLGVSTCADPGSTLKDTSTYEEEHPTRLGPLPTKRKDE